MEYEDYIIEECGLTREEWEQSSPRQKLAYEYCVEVGNEVRGRINDAIDFMENVDESIIPRNEKKKILNKMEKALETFSYPF